MLAQAEKSRDTQWALKVWATITSILTLVTLPSAIDNIYPDLIRWGRLFMWAVAQYRAFIYPLFDWIIPFNLPAFVKDCWAFVALSSSAVNLESYRRFGQPAVVIGWRLLTEASAARSPLGGTDGTPVLEREKRLRANREALRQVAGPLGEILRLPLGCLVSPWTWAILLPGGCTMMWGFAEEGGMTGWAKIWSIPLFFVAQIPIVVTVVVAGALILGFVCSAIASWRMFLVLFAVFWGLVGVNELLVRFVEPSIFEAAPQAARIAAVAIG